MKAEHVPREPLENVKQRSLILGGARRDKVHVRPMLGNESRPRPERHCVPLSIRQNDRSKGGEREEYDRRLCVCDVCNRITFHDGELRRKSCPDHMPQLSGFTRRMAAPGDHRGE